MTLGVLCRFRSVHCINLTTPQALNGKPFDVWSKGLDPTEAQRALGVVGRIDPTVTVQGRRGALPVSDFAPHHPAADGGSR